MLSRAFILPGNGGQIHDGVGGGQGIVIGAEPGDGLRGVCQPQLAKAGGKGLFQHKLLTKNRICPKTYPAVYHMKAEITRNYETVYEENDSQNPAEGRRGVHGGGTGSHP